MSDDVRVANLKEALVLLKAAKLPELASRLPELASRLSEAAPSAEALAAEIEAEMKASNWTVISPQVEPLVTRLCALLQSVSPPLPNPCGRFMCTPCHVDLLPDPHTPAAQ